MIKRARRPLPRQFRRRVSAQTRTFVRRRHARTRKRSTERLRRSVRKGTAMLRDVGMFIRRWSLLAIAALVIALICVALFSSLFQIRQISIQRSQNRVDVRQVIAALTPLYNRHLLFITARDVAARLEDVLPDLQEVTIGKSYPHKLVVRVTLSPLVARLLIEGTRAGGQAAASPPPVRTASGAGFFNPGLQQGSVQQFDYLTENGIYVSTAEAAVQSGATLLTLRIVDWAVRPVPGSLLLDPAFLQRIRETEEALSTQFGQNTSSRIVYLRAEEYHLDIGGGRSLWFDLRSPLNETLRRYRTFLKAVGIKNVKSYVDLRLSGRVVYR